MKLMFKIMVCFIAIVMMSTILLPIHAESTGYWRLSELRVLSDEFLVPLPSNNNLRSISYVTEKNSNLPLSEVAVLGTVKLQETDKSEGLFQVRFKWVHPPMLLEPGIKTTFHVESQKVMDTTARMYDLGIACYHWLVEPGVTEFDSGGISESNSWVSTATEMGDINKKYFEFTPRAHSNTQEQDFIFRVRMQKETGFMRYDYVYKWVEGPKPDLDEIRIFVNGELLLSDVPTMVVSGRTLLPLRAILEALDVEVNWVGSTRTITATKDNTSMILQIDNNTSVLNGQEQIMDVAPIIVDKRTMIPVRYLAESFDFIVEWDSIERIVTIVQ